MYVGQAHEDGAVFGDGGEDGAAAKEADAVVDAFTHGVGRVEKFGVLSSEHDEGDSVWDGADGLDGEEGDLGGDDKKNDDHDDGAAPAAFLFGWRYRWLDFWYRI